MDLYHHVFQLESHQRQQYWVSRFASLTQAEERVLLKVMSLARQDKNQPVHIIMAMAKAAQFDELRDITQSIIDAHITLKVARFWGNIEKIQQRQDWLNDFWVACYAYQHQVTLQYAQRRQRIKAARPQCNGYYEGKSVPFRYASPVRSSVQQFKQQRTLVKPPHHSTACCAH